MWHDQKCKMGAWIWPRALGVGVPRRAPDGLGRGLHDADLSTLYGIRCFVHTLRQDLAAVGNAITETWSNGQTEGQINRLKTLKRAMYGRAGVDLLRARMMPFRVEPNHTN